MLPTFWQIPIKCFKLEQFQKLILNQSGNVVSKCCEDFEISQILTFSLISLRSTTYITHQWWARPRFWGRDRDRDFHFGFHGTETETETFILGLLEPRPRPRLWVWVSWNRDRDRDFYFGSRGIETETETFILGFVESRQRPRILFLVSQKIHGLLLPGVMEQKTKLKAPCIFASTNK